MTPDPDSSTQYQSDWIELEEGEFYSIESFAMEYTGDDHHCVSVEYNDRHIVDTLTGDIAAFVADVEAASAVNATAVNATAAANATAVNSTAAVNSTVAANSTVAVNSTAAVNATASFNGTEYNQTDSNSTEYNQTVAIVYNQTDWSGHHHASKEVQLLEVDPENVKEKFRITVENAHGGKYVVMFVNPLHNPRDPYSVQIWESNTIRDTDSADTVWKRIRWYYWNIWSTDTTVERIRYDADDIVTTSSSATVKTVFEVTVVK